MFDAGDLVWALLRPFPWWPAIACHVPGKGSCLVRKGEKEYLSVVFIEEVPTTALVPLQNIKKLESLHKTDRRPGGAFYSDAEGWELAAKLAKVFLKIPNSGRIAAIDTRLQLAKTKERLRRQMAKEARKSQFAAGEPTNRKHSLGSRDHHLKLGRRGRLSCASTVPVAVDSLELTRSKSTTEICQWPSAQHYIKDTRDQNAMLTNNSDCNSLPSGNSSRCSSSLSLEFGCNAGITGLNSPLSSPVGPSSTTSPRSSVIVSPSQHRQNGIDTVTTALTVSTVSSQPFFTHLNASMACPVAADKISSHRNSSSYSDDSGCVSDIESISIASSSPPQSPSSATVFCAPSPAVSPGVTANTPVSSAHCSYSPKHRWLNTFLSSNYSQQLVTTN